MREKFELSNCGDYQLIYPPRDPDLIKKYSDLQWQAVENWQEFTTGRKRQPPNKFSAALPGAAKKKPAWKAGAQIDPSSVQKEA